MATTVGHNLIYNACYVWIRLTKNLAWDKTFLSSLVNLYAFQIFIFLSRKIWSVQILADESIFSVPNMQIYSNYIRYVKVIDYIN